MTAALEAVLRRDRLVVLASLATIVVLAWLYLVWSGESASMTGVSGMDETAGMAGMAGRHPGGGLTDVAPAAWSATEAAVMLLMWTVMMIGMMTPSAAPMILLYARVARGADARGRPFAASGWFTLGYLLAWSAFAAAATAAQTMLEAAALLTPMMASASPAFGAVLLLAAGIYQWTGLKHACLASCRSPLQFILAHGGFRGDPRGAVWLGWRHGLYCIGCCWPLMLLLFLGGVMNLLWIAALSALVLSEKLLRFGPAFARATGCVLIAAGIAVAAGLW